MSATYAFQPLPGTNWDIGQEPTIVDALSQLADEIKQNIYGISGYRTPAQSIAAGGNATDPHTRGQAADIGAGNSERSSMSKVTDLQLAKAGLWRPFDYEGDPNAEPLEINHVQLLPIDGGPAEGGAAGAAEATKLAREASEHKGGGGGALGSLLTGAEALPFPLGAAASALNAKESVVPAGEDVANKAKSEAEKLAEGVAGDVGGWLGEVAPRAGLYVLLVGGGIALIVAGVGKATGLRPAHIAKAGLKLGAAGALVA